MNLLLCENIHKNFGGLKAVNDVDLKLEEGEILGLIGPNGAGKTTLFNLITGFLPPTSGQILYKGNDISKSPPHVIAKLGMVRTFQKINVFRELSVLENVLIGKHLKIRANFLQSLIQSKKKKLEEKQTHEEVLKILDSVDLAQWRNHKAKNLPLGLQRTLGIAVALAADPEVLLLDEPASGMNNEETSHLIEVARKIHSSGITLLIVEHDMNVVMQLCERIIVLDYGAVVAEGGPEEIQKNRKVIEVYLGKGYENAAETK